MAHVINFADHAPSLAPRALTARIRKIYDDARRYRALHDELNAMSDRELADLDLSRHSVRDVARAAVYG